MLYIGITIGSVILLSLLIAAEPIPRVLVVSFDGFRHNYVNKRSTPYLYELRREATYAKYMKNIFPTKTFPNHHSISTGVYAEDHGVVNNHVLENGEVLNYGSQLFMYNKDVVPIWITLEKQGGVSGIMMWLGGEFTYQNTTATFCQALNKKTPWVEKVDTLIRWFLDEQTPANLVMLYFDEPDVSSHAFGTHSPQVRAQIQWVDYISKYIGDKLKENKLDVNVFLLGDHGMIDVRFKNIIDLTPEKEPKLAKIRDLYTSIVISPTIQVFPKDGKTDEVFEAFREISLTNRNFKVYLKSEMPVIWRYRNNSRVSDILIMAEKGYGFHDLRKLKQGRPIPGPGSVFGVHGYDNKMTEMYPFFMAYGPQIVPNYEIKPFMNVDLFPLWCKLLRIKPTPNHGDYTNVVKMLRCDPNYN